MRNSLPNRILKTTLLALALTAGLPFAVPSNFSVLKPATHASEIGKGTDNIRMSKSPSPYLRTHSHDLVRWYAWGEEAFKAAKAQDKPLMVSFGYHACHWCHVMQEEHFNNESMARTINENYIPVLVDRERRPTLDESYMLVTEALTQRGGWPNTVFMTADKKPFYGTSYVPLENFGKITNAITNSWINQRSILMEDADKLTKLIGNYLQRQEKAAALTPEVIKKIADDLAGQFDFPSGGMGNGPKFFQASTLSFLLQQAERTGNEEALDAVETTLKAVASGGINDHLEGGLHRYAVDPAWRVPHFEKMLYDQALMGEVFTNAYRITGNPLYAETARKILDYVLDDMTDANGGFYATRDADSEGEEGTYYIWTKEQIIKVLGEKEGNHVAGIFGIHGAGEFAGKIILNKDALEGEKDPRLEQALPLLTKARHSRPKPGRDEKILAGWNGLMITAFAKGGVVLGEKKYQQAATKAAQFLWNNMRDKDGKIFRSYFSGSASVTGTLDDHAKPALGFLHLYDATGDKIWLERSQQLASIIMEDFEDKEIGDFYASSNQQGFARLKPRSDASLPSANGSTLALLARLSKRLADPKNARRSEKTMAALSGMASASPAGSTAILNAADSYLRGEQGAVQFSGNGAVRITALPSSNREKILLRISVANGWHVNSDKPLEEDYIATNLQILVDGKTIKTATSYPKSTVKTLGFSKKPLALLENTFDITAELNGTTNPVVSAKLTLQACSNEICLLPETLSLRLPLR